MNTDQEIKSMCWYNDSCVDEINRFVDTHKEDDNITMHLKSLSKLLSLCKGDRLLDLGTGSAMIAPMCTKMGFEFYGCDLPHIILGCSMRNQPDYFYRVCDLIEHNLSWIRKFDVLVLNGVIDVMYNGVGILNRVLTHANRYVIVHRQEITEQKENISIIKNSYGGKTYHSIINRNFFKRLVDEAGFDIVEEEKLNFGDWEGGGSSFLLKNRNFEDKRYENHPLRQLRNRIQTELGFLKIVVGAGDTIHNPEWITTNVEELDVENVDDWKFLFKETKANNIFSEHVWEHLANPDKANKNVFDYLTDGGRFRVAVPDGYHPDPNYIEAVRPGGIGAGADDHKFLYNIDTITESLEKAGFIVHPLEYWKNGEFFCNHWTNGDGRVGRSRFNDERNGDGPVYTSLIVDAIKP